MIDDDWVNIESSNLYEKIKPPTLEIVIPKPPEIQQMTLVNKSPPESHHNVMTHRNVNTVNSIPEDIIIYRGVSSKHERGIDDCVVSLKEYIREAKLFLIKCSYYVNSWDDIV